MISYVQTQMAIMKASFEIELPAVEFVRIEYIPFSDRYSMILFMRPGEWHFECLLSKDDVNKPCPYDMVKPIIKELKDYLNPVWC
jgi:hypothetical protein